MLSSLVLRRGRGVFTGDLKGEVFKCRNPGDEAFIIEPPDGLSSAKVSVCPPSQVGCRISFMATRNLCNLSLNGGEEGLLRAFKHGVRSITLHKFSLFVSKPAEDPLMI